MPIALAELPDEHLESELATLASRMWATTARWLELVGEFDRREGWLSWGCRSAAEWLSWQCGVAPGTARDQVRVARRLRELPEVAAAFGTGTLSYSKVRAVVRVATPATESEFVGFALHATADQLERAIAVYRRAARRDGDDAASFSGRDARWHHPDAQTMEFTLRLPADLGGVFAATIDAAAQMLRGHDRAVTAAAVGVSAKDVSAETPVAERSLGQRRADALVELVTTGRIGGEVFSDRGAGGSRRRHAGGW